MLNFSWPECHLYSHYAVMVLLVLGLCFNLHGHYKKKAAAESANNMAFTSVIFLLEKQRNAALPVQIFH